MANKIEYDYHAMLKVNRAIAKSAGLDIKYLDDDNAAPHTDGKTLFIPRPLPTFTEEEWHRWLNTNYHEVGHSIPECMDSWTELKKRGLGTKGFYGALSNLLEDYRVDKTRCHQYRGMMQSNESAMHYHVSKCGNNPELASHASKELDVIHTLLAFDSVCRSEWTRSLRGLDSLYSKNFTSQQKEWFDQLIDQYLDQYSNNMDTAADVFDTLDSMLDNVFKMDSEKEKEKNREQNQTGKGKGQPGKEGESEGEDAEAVGVSNGEDGEESARTAAAEIDYQKLLESDHSSKLDPRGTHTPLKINYDSYKGAAAYTPHTDTSNVIVDFHADTNTRAFSGSAASWRSAPVYRIDRKIADLHIPAMTQEARRLLQVMTRKRYSYNQKKGKLDASRVYRVCMPESSISERLFKTKTENKALDTAVSVLVDYSGSMGGSKIPTAIAAGYALNALCSMLRLNCEIAGFSEPSETCNYHMIFKPFNVPVSDNNLKEYMSKGSSCMSNNADGDNILVAWHRLMQQKQKRKVLIVLSDGSPATWAGDAYGFTKDVVKGLEARGDVDIIGIGIEDDNVERIYKTNKVINNVSELPKALIYTLEHVILD